MPECLYRLDLINRDGQLDLRTKREAILGVIQELKNTRMELQRCDVSAVDQHSVTLLVEETGDWWHCQFGKKLANEWGMRHFCNPKDQRQMFSWSRQAITTFA